MQHSDNNDVQVQSTATLIKACVIAVLTGSVVLLIAILPAEYNIDPTGLGSAAGLTKIAQATNYKDGNVPEMTQSKDIEKLVIIDAPTVSEIKQNRIDAGTRADVIDITIPANKGLEYKLLLNQHGHFEYEWKTDGTALFFDFHGEPQGDTTGYYESYAITTSNQMKGSLVTPFAGNHGWYWKNNTSSPVTVTLTTKGTYKIKG
ncbi:hypothetical protein [uncultured Shewanella sp.]|uniref:hypothetical protein n=1 Tax=uncultured Shewanella sp. TaxID=173975 RepID=UPI0026152D3B|nr:hypothetical protein [uncultured Shewanella sp.]